MSKSLLFLDIHHPNWYLWIFGWLNRFSHHWPCGIRGWELLFGIRPFRPKNIFNANFFSSPKVLLNLDNELRVTLQLPEPFHPVLRWQKCKPLFLLELKFRRKLVSANLNVILRAFHNIDKVNFASLLVLTLFYLWK